MPETLQLLTYEYVPDILERRGPHREGHLAAIARWHETGGLIMAGAAGDPVSKGILVFRADADVQAYLRDDPYNDAGLVASSTIEPWTVVTPLG